MGQVRKKRCDRNFVLYRIVGDGQDYIGLTVALGRAFTKSVKIRVQKHISRAKIENKNWTLCEYLRNADNIEYEILEVVRGRKAAYQRERELIKQLAPTLNTF